MNLDAGKISPHRGDETVAAAARGHSDQHNLALQVRIGDPVIEDVGEGDVREGGTLLASKIDQHLAVLVDRKLRLYVALRVLNDDLLVAEIAKIDDQVAAVGQRAQNRERERHPIAVMKARN